MGIYNALYTGSSGLSAFGESVRVIGDNIANVNSLGFKSQNVVFSDVLSQTVGVTRSNIANQVGNGVRIGMITRDQQQGSIQNTTSATDMAINGNGMFALKDPASNQTYYSRAGSFILDKDSNLIDGQGFVVQGWATDTAGQAVGNITDVTFGGLAAQAQPTTAIDLGVTLDSNAALLPAGTAFDPNDPATFHYKAEANIYDSLGQQHVISVYYIKEANNTWSWHAGVNGSELAGGIPGEQVILGSATSNFNSTNRDLVTPALQAGVLSTRTYDGLATSLLATQIVPGATFVSNSTFDLDVTINGVLYPAGTTVLANTKVTSATIPAGTNFVTGKATMDTTILDGSVFLANSTYSTDVVINGTTYLAGTTIPAGTVVATSALQAGATLLTGDVASYTLTAAPAPVGDSLRAGTEISANTVFSSDVWINDTLIPAGQTVSAAMGGGVTVSNSSIPLNTQVLEGNVITKPAANKLVFGNQGELVTEIGPGINFPWKSAATSTINFNFGDATGLDQQQVLGDGLNGTVQMAGSFATRQITRDGYASGFLDKLETDSTGRIFGVFTNGQRRPLFQVALAKFPNDAVLNHVGNNLQQETIASGSPILEKPGNGGMGSITPYGLEQSNVDLAGEFVKLIVVQRGYEANSKTISTTDQMLSSLMQIKR